MGTLQCPMLLEPMLSRLANVQDIDSALRVGLRDFVSLHGAEMGDVQFVGEGGSLVIVEARGLSREFLRVFRRVHPESGSACGRAARQRRSVFIPDVSVDPEYAQYAAFAAEVPFSSVLSCPMFRPDGTLLGMISALSSAQFSPTVMELEAACAYGDALAGSVLKLLRIEDVPAFAERKSSELVDSA